MQTGFLGPHRAQREREEAAATLRGFCFHRSCCFRPKSLMQFLSSPEPRAQRMGLPDYEGFATLRRFGLRTAFLFRVVLPTTLCISSASAGSREAGRTAPAQTRPSSWL